VRTAVRLGVCWEYAVNVGGEGVADGFIVGAPYVCDVTAWSRFVDSEGVIGVGMGRGHDVDQFGGRHLRVRCGCCIFATRLSQRVFVTMVIDIII
jgi:hypothetical protein